MKHCDDVYFYCAVAMVDNLVPIGSPSCCWSGAIQGVVRRAGGHHGLHVCAHRHADDTDQCGQLSATGALPSETLALILILQEPAAIVAHAKGLGHAFYACLKASVDAKYATG